MNLSKFEDGINDLIKAKAIDPKDKNVVNEYHDFSLIP